MARDDLTPAVQPQTDDPFIVMDEPSVRRTMPCFDPFVCYNRPFVRIIRRQYGFTLIELIITLVLASVLLGIGVPNLRLFIQNSRVTTQSNEVVGDLATARSESIKRNGRVVLCRTDDPAATTPTCETGSPESWETGWLVFLDANKDNSFSTADGDTLLKVHDPLSGDITLRGNGDSVGDYVTFTPEGVTTMAAPAATDPPHHLKLCDPRGAGFARAIVLDRTGRARIERQSTFPSLACP